MNKMAGTHYAGLDEDLVSTQNLIVGIKGLKQIISSK